VNSVLKLNYILRVAFPLPRGHSGKLQKVKLMDFFCFFGRGAMCKMNPRTASTCWINTLSLAIPSYRPDTCPRSWGATLGKDPLKPLIIAAFPFKTDLKGLHCLNDYKTYCTERELHASWKDVFPPGLFQILTLLQLRRIYVKTFKSEYFDYCMFIIQYMEPHKVGFFDSQKYGQEHSGLTL